MNYLLSKMICIQRQDRTLPFTNPRVKQQSGHYTLRAAEGAFQCEKGRPAQQPVKPAPAKAFREVEGRPTWKLTMPATALAFPRGRPSPRLAGQYEGPSMRAVGWFPANNLGNAASGRDHIGARPFAREESESAKDPFKPQGGAPSGKSLGRSREDRHRRTSVKADKKQKKGRLDADPTNQLKHMVPPTGSTQRRMRRDARDTVPR